MEIIDAHVHLYPPEINRAPAAWAAARNEPHWSLLCTRTRKNGRPVQTFPDPDTLLRAMDAANVTRAILQGWYWQTHESCALHNKFYADCIRLHPDRLSACAAIHPRAGASRVRDEIHRAADHGFVGLGELSPHSQNINAGDPALHAAFALAGELGLAVNLHVTESAKAATECGVRNAECGMTTGSTAMKRGQALPLPSSDAKAKPDPFPGKILTPLADFTGWAQAHPRTRFVLAHWGARLPLALMECGDSSPLLTGRFIAPPPNIFYDTAASPLIYGAEGSAALWREMTAAAGADRILFGTDYPLVLYPKTETEPSMASLASEAKASGLDARDLAAIFSETAKNVFKITQSSTSANPARPPRRRGGLFCR